MACSTPLVLSRIDFSESCLNQLLHLEQDRGMRIVPSLKLSAGVRRLTPPGDWLRMNGLPAVSSPPRHFSREQETGEQDSRGRRKEAPVVGTCFITPVVHDTRGNTLMLPNFTRTSGGTNEILQLDRITSQLSAGVRKRFQAVATCTAEKLAITGITGIEMAVTAEDAVIITDLIAFPAFMSAVADITAKHALTRIHLAATLGLPLPDFLHD